MQRPFDPDPGVGPGALALWINLYNALVIRQVLARFPLASIRPSVAGVPNWPAFLAFFSRPVITLQDQPLSLDRIEHGLLRPGSLTPASISPWSAPPGAAPCCGRRLIAPSTSPSNWRRTPNGFCATP